VILLTCLSDQRNATGGLPDIIIADEPTTALDVTIQAQLLELLQAQVPHHGTALLLITHNLGVVARYMPTG
jgi:peptide/nickel transport system ATP-binding protein